MRNELLIIGRSDDLDAKHAIAFLKWIRERGIQLWEKGWKYWKNEKYIGYYLTEEQLYEIYLEETNKTP